jgi:ligand-binding sensor domain-containing protein/signal transduction histidine kinase
MGCRSGAIGLAVLAASLSGARLPVHTYAAADGMPRDAAFCIVPDSRGFLWVCTNEGLSWFDGYRFNNYGVEQGLAHRVVNAVLQTSGGTLLAGTDGGISRLDLTGSGSSFRTIPSDAPSPVGISDLIQDRDGVVWGAGFNGIFRLEHPDNVDARVHYINIAEGKAAAGNGLGIKALAVDPDGTLWIGTSAGLARRFDDGRIDWPAGLPATSINSLLIDRQKRLWVGTLHGLWRVQVQNEGKPLRLDRVFTTRDGLRSERIHRLYRSSQGIVWVGTASSLSELSIDPEGHERFQNYSESEGLRGRRVTAIAEDAGGNLWVGMDQGLSRISRSGFVAYSEREGMGNLAIAALVVTPSREVISISNHTDRLVLHRLEDDHFIPVLPFFPPSIHYFGWGWDQIALIDREGAWWIATGEGLLRYPRVARLEMLAHTRPTVYNMRNAGLPGNDVFRIFEDTRGDIWISAMEGAPVRWHRSTNQFERLPPSSFPGQVSAFAEDRAGNVWMGVSNEPGTGNPTGLIRYRDGRFEPFLGSGKGAPGWIASLLIDHLGRLWIGTTEKGLEVVSDPAAKEPRVTQFPTRLSSVSVRCLAEDPQGRIWAGTARGMDRLDPSTGEIRYFNAAQGYPGGGCSALRIDAQGSLWAGSPLGLSRFVPSGEGAEGTPPVFLTGVSVEGRAKAGAERFPLETDLGQLTPQQNQLRIEFSSPAAVEGRAIRYEYALEHGGRVSNLVSDQRTVEYPGLSPGRYQFRVSAVDERGRRSAVPAAIFFEILPPVWARWWFLTLAAAAAAAGVHALYRFRLSKQLDLERLRTRIAADLHDDLGTSLSRVAIMSETVRLEMDRSPEESRERLSEIAATARNLVDGMSDLVWSINPRKDDMRSLLRRVREFASGVLEAEGIDWALEIQSGVDDLILNAEQRRHLFLILKEAIANAAKHARCSSVRIDARVGGSRFEVSIADNGRGMLEETPGDGNGLRNMRRRAEALGGSLTIESADGTRIFLAFPIHSDTIHSLQA